MPPVIDVVIAVIRISLAFRDVSVSLLKVAFMVFEERVRQDLAFLPLRPSEAVALKRAFYICSLQLGSFLRRAVTTLRACAVLIQR